jgi:hypothetical protein
MLGKIIKEHVIWTTILTVYEMRIDSLMWHESLLRFPPSIQNEREWELNKKWVLMVEIKTHFVK